MADRYLTSNQENLLLDLAEKETANSLEVANLLFDSEDAEGAKVDSGFEEDDEASLRETSIEDELATISEDLDSRWRGALFSLSSRNPEASRHFCSSAREIFTDILERQAPDQDVEKYDPQCQRTPQGKPTRRSKIQYLLRRKEIAEDAFVEFVEEDVKDVVELFGVLNAGTHGRSGHFAISVLAAIKRRVEDGLVFLSRIAV